MESATEIYNNPKKPRYKLGISDIPKTPKPKNLKQYKKSIINITQSSKEMKTEQNGNAHAYNPIPKCSSDKEHKPLKLKFRMKKTQDNREGHETCN